MAPQPNKILPPTVKILRILPLVAEYGKLVKLNWRHGNRICTRNRAHVKSVSSVQAVVTSLKQSVG